MTWGVRRYAVVLSVCVVASGIIGVTSTANAAPEAPTATSPRTGVTQGAPQVAASGGMYGELGGNPQETVPQLAVQPAEQPSTGGSGAASGDDGTYEETNSTDGGTDCSVYANGAGMGSHCSSGGGVSLDLIERFPGMHFVNCRYEDPPAGFSVPVNPSPGEQKWQLRTCLTAIDWFSYSGGDQKRFMMDLVLVDVDFDTTYHETRLSRFLWDEVQTTYPVPMLRMEPKTFPLVNQKAYFTFSWLNGQTSQPVQEGPYANDPNGGPYVESRPNNGMVMRARALSMRIDPQVTGVEPKTCDPANMDYLQNRSPEDQPSKCFFVFPRSSAAQNLNQNENNPGNDKNSFRAEITVRWQVQYSFQGEPLRQLGNGYDMLLYQTYNVLDAEAVNTPLYSELLGS